MVFTLQDGARVRDNGEDILFSAASEPAKQAALLYVRKKWGKAAELVNNAFKRKSDTLERPGISR